MVASSSAAWHLVPVDNYIGDRLVRWGWGAFFGRSAHAGLFRKGAKDGAMTRAASERHLVPGAQGTTISRRVSSTMSTAISPTCSVRLDRYTTRAPRICGRAAISAAMAHNLRRIVSRFWKCYVGRRAIAKGPCGFLIALCAALYPILSYLKARLASATI